MNSGVFSARWTLRAIAFAAGCCLPVACVGISAPTPTAISRSPTVTSPPATFAVSPSPSVSATTAPTIAVTPSPTLSAEAGQVIRAFIDNFALEQPPFHVDTDIEFVGRSGSETGSGELTVDGDISGEDFDGEVVFPTGQTMSVVFVDGAAYGRAEGGDWMVLPSFVQTQPLNPFGLLDPSDLAYIGQAERDGRALHQLQTDKWIGGELEAEALSDIQLLSNVFDIYVTDRGIPVEAILDFSISGVTLGRDAEFDYHVVYRFSNVGDPVRIEAPI